MFLLLFYANSLPLKINNFVQSFICLNSGIIILLTNIVLVFFEVGRVSNQLHTNVCLIADVNAT